MYGYVYLITNNINGKKYIGLRSSSTFDDSYWGSGKLIQKAIAKYGRENFTREILHWCETPEQLVECEQREIINRNAADSSEYYNLIATKTPIMIGESNPFFGKQHSEETKKKLSLALKGIPRGPRSEETKIKMKSMKNNAKIILHKETELDNGCPYINLSPFLIDEVLFSPKANISNIMALMGHKPHSQEFSFRYLIYSNKENEGKSLVLRIPYIFL